MCKDKQESKHNGLVYKLRDELFQTQDYEKMLLFWEYSKNGLIGEVDLLAMADEIYDFYEVKTTFHSKSHTKARQQYGRFQEAFPRWDINGFMYCGDGRIRRLRT